MSDFVTKVKKGSSVKPIHDARIPNASAGDAGKTLKFDENGNLIASSTGSLEDIESQVELLQEAVDGKIGFDGVVELRRIGSTLGILSQNIPSDGVYALKQSNNDYYSGVIYAGASGPNEVTAITILNGEGIYLHNYFNKANNLMYSSTYRYPVGTKLYQHVLTYNQNKKLIFVSNSNSQTVITYVNYSYKVNNISVEDWFNELVSVSLVSNGRKDRCVLGAGGGGGSNLTINYYEGSSTPPNFVVQDSSLSLTFTETITEL